MIKKAKPCYIPFLLTIILLCPAIFLNAQVKIEGKVIEDDDHPIPNASVKLSNHPEGIVCNEEGFFSFRVNNIKASDTLIISSVGYEPLTIPVLSAVKKGKFVLKPFSKKMETVVVRSFGKEDMAGAKTDNVGYFRSWNTEHTGGEIGRSVYVPHKEYQVSRVRFKIFSTCDTTIIRVRIREFANGFPGKELLKDSVAQVFYNASVADKSYDFDLSKYSLILNKENIFVSFEVLKGSSGTKYCSLSFVGSEPGSYISRPNDEKEWAHTHDYAIHLKVFFRYD